MISESCNLFKFPALVALVVFLTTGCCNEDPVITSFAFNDLSSAAIGQINASEGTIKVTVPSSADLSALTPTIAVGNPECQSLHPASGVMQDFRIPVTYEVTNEQGNSRQYEVWVTAAEIQSTLDITWDEKTPLPATPGWMPAVELNGKIYVISGGLDETNITKKMYVYDPETDIWDDTKASLGVGRIAHSADVVNGKIYVMGGSPAAVSLALDDILIYDPLQDTWNSGGTMPFGRAAHATCVIGRKIYVFGGELEEPTDNIIGDVSVYDTETGNWTTLAPLPTARCYLNADVVDGKIYVAGGTPGSPFIGSDLVGIYDPATDTWSDQTVQLPTGKMVMGSCVVKDRIFYICGTPMVVTAGSPSVQVYSPVEDKWYKGTSLSGPRLAAGVCSYNGEIVVAGGAVSSPPWATNTNSMVIGIPVWE